MKGNGGGGGGGQQEYKTTKQTNKKDEGRQYGPALYVTSTVKLGWIPTTEWTTSLTEII